LAVNLLIVSVPRASSPYRERKTSPLHTNARHKAATNPQSTKPNANGINAETAVHFQLRVSL
jgi:hypothetical protein